MADVELDESSDRVAAGKAAGDDFTDDMETIRDTLDATDESGTTLGTMIEGQLDLTEAETSYQVKSGIPTKASKAVKAQAGQVKQT